MRTMYRWTWKVRRTYRNIKRLFFVLVLLGIIMFLQKNGTDWIPNDASVENMKEGLITGIKWIVVSTLLLGCYKLFRFYLKRRQLKRSNIREIDRMAGEEFEQYLTFFFSQLGFSAKTTKASRDFGCDIILKKDGITTVVQAKRYRNKVDGKAIQEVVASKNVYGAEQAFVVTNSIFTKPAIELAKANDVELWDRSRLVKELAKLNMGMRRRDEHEVW
jgi:restriction system protein